MGKLGDKIRKALGNALASADSAEEPAKFLPTGYASLDFALGGGFMRGRLSEVYGESTVGKSLIVYRTLVRNQMAGGVSGLFNTEEAYTAEFFRLLGGDPNALLLYPNPLDTEQVCLEDVFIKMDDIMSLKQKEGSDEPIVLGWDGIAATIPKACLDVSLNDVNMKYNLARAQAMSNACPRIQTLAARTDTTIIATNQIRESPDPFERQVKRPGGRTYPFFASQWVELRKGATIKAETGDAIGHWIEGTVTKTRLGPALRKFRLPCYTRCEYPHPVFDVPLQPGIHEAEGLWEFLRGTSKQGKGGEDSKIQAYFTMPDGKLAIDSESKGWFQLHAHFGGAKFRRTDFLKVLADTPALGKLPQLEGI